MSDSAIAELFCLESMSVESMGVESMDSMGVESMDGMNGMCVESMVVESVGVESVYASIKTPYTRVVEESILFYTELGEYYLAKTSEVPGGIEYTYESSAKNELPFTVFIKFATDAELAEFEEFVE